jgi:CIC family chloride channel protein
MRELIVAHPDETVQSALRRMGQNDIGRLPVVDSVNPRKLVGWLSRVDIVRAYDLALARRSEVRHQVAQVRLGAISGLDVFEIDVESGSVLDGKLLSEVKWPEESLVASVRRGRRVTIPHGETRLQADDQVTVIAKPEDEAQIKALLNRQYELEQPGLKETKPSSKASQKTDQKAKA